MKQQFFQAVQAFQRGSFEEAIAGCRTILQSMPDQPDTLQLLGASLCEAGQAEQGFEVLRRAAELSSANPEAWYNLGRALLQGGEAEEALAAFDRALALAPDHPSAHNNRGSALKALGRLDEAAEAYRRVLSRQPGHAGAAYNLANVELERGNAEQAEAGYRQALAADGTHRGAWRGLGAALLDQGRYPEAVRTLEQSVARDPEQAEAWSLLGRARAGVEDTDGSLEAHRRSVELQPESADYWNNVGGQFTALGSMEEAEEALRRALSLDPAHRGARSNLAALYELGNRLEECEELLAQGLADAPEDVMLRLVKAKLLKRRGALEEARSLLEALTREELDQDRDRDVRFTLGQVLDRLERSESAFRAFEEANAVARSWFERSGRPADRTMAGYRELLNRLSPDWVSGWQQATDHSVPAPAFLLGFQRSGTTLLDTMLGAHGGVEVMEEQPVVSRLLQRLQRDYGRYPDVLAELDAEAWNALRRAYLDEASALSDWEPGDERLLLDKTPLSTVHLGLITRLFPDARVVLALRHPCDVCLSCFMQDFTLTPFMLNYTSVEGVARVYDRVMALGERYHELLDFQRHVIRYEDLVEETEGELRRLIDFLGLEWRDRVLDHTGHARDRGLISTPSYHQVSRPVYRSAKYRWHRYREQLEPALPTLQPWIERFGYADEADS